MDNNNSDAPLKVIINGQEFDETEAQELIDTGRKTRELETKWSTKLDKVWPEYGQTREQLKSISEERDALKAQVEEFKAKKEEGVETPQDVRQAQEAARKLGFVLEPDLDKAGYVKKADLDSYFQTKEKEKQAVNSVLADADKLEKAIDGSDGRPKFNKRAILAYASAYGFQDLTEAYEDMHKEQVDAWKEQQIASQKAKGLKTFQPNGKKGEPGNPKVNDDNFRTNLREKLWGAQEE